ncbi:MAG: indolepyruvate oxidoreductase subunit beta [Oscillospiraceae bacterium]|nr:indolepyruvate oxidoreductase subunit beta [Oscillospiraceae bacterium]
MAVKSIMIVGVGGQGTLLASRLLGSALIENGFEVKVSEIHGMSQRGGSVVTYVKYGDEVNSPTIEVGEADIILAFEKLEAVRWLSFLKPDGKMVVNTQCIDPMPVITGVAEYPQNITQAINDSGASMIEIDALSLAVKAGSAKAVNVVLIGAMASHMQLSYDTWINAVKSTVPEKFLDLNLEAFRLGYEFEKSNSVE